MIEQTIKRAKPTKFPCGYVYLLDIGVGVYKIGATNNPDRRLKQNQKKLPRTATIKYLIYSDDYEQFEKSCHTRFWSRHLIGEWFVLDDDDLAWFAERSL